jgi:hypothetical protein
MVKIEDDDIFEEEEERKKGKSKNGGRRKDEEEEEDEDIFGEVKLKGDTKCEWNCEFIRRKICQMKCQCKKNGQNPLKLVENGKQKGKGAKKGQGRKLAKEKAENHRRLAQPNRRQPQQQQVRPKLNSLVKGNGRTHFKFI